MNKDHVTKALKALELRIKYGVGTVDELEDAQIAVDMYKEILEQMEEE